MNMDSINKYIKENLSKKRLIHVEGVKNTAVYLATKYGEDTHKAEIAALCHDIAKGMSIEESDCYVKKIGLEDKYLGNLNLAHSKIGAYIIEHRYNITDKDIINAVSFHTTGRAKMSLLEKIIYIADAIEPGRDYPGVDTLRETCEKDINAACLMSLEQTISHVQSKGNYLDIDTLQARDYYKQKEKLNGK